jgi:site-specific recombinase XerD
VTAPATELSVVEQPGLTVATTDAPPPLDRNPAAVYLRSLRSEQSQRSMGSSLRTLARLLDATIEPENALTGIRWDQLRAGHAIALRGALAQAPRLATDPEAPPRPLGNKTVARHLFCLKGVLRTSWELGHIDREEYARATNFRVKLARTPPPGRALDREEVLSLFRACDSSSLGLRHRAMLAMLFAGGLRRTEVAGVGLGDIDPSARSVLVRRGKGGHSRLVPLGSAWEEVERWLKVRGDNPGPVLLAFTPKREMTRRGLGPSGIYKALRGLGAGVGIKISPHDGRRTRITELLDHGASIATVADLAGHANLETTRRYDRSGVRRVRTMVEAVGFATDATPAAPAPPAVSVDPENQ